MKSSLESCTNKAEAQKVDDKIVRRIQMNEEWRKKLLNILKGDQTTIPLVQRINEKVFVVRCDVSLSFPIGLLHVICSIEPNGIRYV